MFYIFSVESVVINTTVYYIWHILTFVCFVFVWMEETQSAVPYYLNHFKIHIGVYLLFWRVSRRRSSSHRHHQPASHVTVSYTYNHGISHVLFKFLRLKIKCLYDNEINFPIHTPFCNVHDDSQTLQMWEL